MAESAEGKAIISRIDEMIAERKTQAEPWWESVTEVLIPRLSDFDGTKTAEALLAPGFYDSSGRSALDIAGNAVFSMMVGPGVDWLALGMSNEEVMDDPASKEYFDRTRMVVLDALYEWGFYENVKPATQYGMSLGTVATTVTREMDQDFLNYILWHPGDVYVRVGADRRISEVCIKQEVRYKDLTHYEMISPELMTKIEKNPNEKLKLYYYINKTSNDVNPIIAEMGMPWYITHVTEDGELLHTSGLNSLPGSFWTYEKDPRMDYGLCPGYHTLRDMLQLNKMQKLLLQETEKRVNPPIWIPNQGSSQLYMEPGSLNYSSMDPNLFPRKVYEPNDVSMAMAMKQELVNVINTRFYTDFFLAVMSRTHRRTAQEIAATQREIGAQIAPLVYTIESNFLRPQIKTTLRHLQEMGKLPEPSNKILQNTSDFPLEVNFIGPLSLAQKYLYHTEKNIRAINEVLVPAAQLDPAAIDYVNIPRLVQDSMKGLSGANGIIRSETEVAEIQERRAAMQQMQMQAEQQSAALGNSKSVEAGSPAEAVLDGQG